MYRAASARQSRGGSGLGLAICKKIVEEHGGNIYATSQVGKGTTMVFTLKKYIPKIAENEISDEDESVSEGSQKKENYRKDGQKKNTIQIKNPLKKRRDTDEQDIDN